MKPGRLDVGIIGAGNVGIVLAAALAGVGHTIVGVTTTDERRIERASAMLPGVPVLDPLSVVERCDLVLIAIPEPELEQFVAGLAETGAFKPGQLVVHTSASFGIGVLDPATRAGAIPLALHPAIVFTGTSMDLVRLREATIAVTAPTPVLPIAEALVLEIGAEPVVIDEQDRATYAEAISVARDFSRSIVEQSSRLLRSIGVDNPAAVIESVALSSVQTALARSMWIESQPEAPQEDA